MKRTWSETAVSETPRLTEGELCRAARRHVEEAWGGSKVAQLLREAAGVRARVSATEEATARAHAHTADELSSLFGGLSLGAPARAGLELEGALPLAVLADDDMLKEEEEDGEEQVKQSEDAKKETDEDAEEEALLARVEEMKVGDEMARLLADERVARLWDELVTDVIMRDVLFCAKATAPLTADEWARAERVIRESSPQGVEDLAVLENVPVQGKDMCLLRDGTWLNDEIVNFAMKMLQLRNRRYLAAGLRVPRCHFFNSFLLSSLAKKGYAGVRRWSKRAKIKIMELDRVIIPYNIGNTHWTLTMIDLPRKQLVFLDSLGGRGDTAFRLLRTYVQGEADAYSPELGVDASAWDTVCLRVPRQNNGCDCGVFTIMFADTLAEDRPFDWGQADMPYFRRRLALDILRAEWL